MNKARPFVLIVTYGFPPYIPSLGGAIRMLKLAEYLQDQGCEVQVICAKTQFVGSFGYDALLARLSIVYVDDPLARRASQSFGKAAGAGAGSLSGMLKRRVKSLLLDLLTPDTGIMARAGMARAVATAVAAHPGLTLISSGPPHSAHLLGLRAKRDHPTIQWIVDFRDSWNGTPLFRKRLPVMQWLNRRFERRVLDACDHFTFISKPIGRNAHARDADALARKSHLVMNGFDAEVLANLSSRPADGGPARIGYFGAISDAATSYRDPTVLLEVLADAPELDLVLEMYGTIQIGDHWTRRLGKRLFIGPQLSHAEAVRTMSEMDALMLLHTREDGAEEVVTGKVFEYIASGREIISVGPSQMAVNELLRGDPSAHCVLHTDRAAMLATLRAVAANKAAGIVHSRSPSQIQKFTRNSQYATILALVSAHAQREET